MSFRALSSTAARVTGTLAVAAMLVALASGVEAGGWADGPHDPGDGFPTCCGSQ